MREVLISFPQKENSLHTDKWRCATKYDNSSQIVWNQIVQVKISAYVFVDISKSIPYVISTYVNVCRHIDLHIYMHVCMCML